MVFCSFQSVICLLEWFNLLTFWYLLDSSFQSLYLVLFISIFCLILILIFAFLNITSFCKHSCFNYIWMILFASVIQIFQISIYVLYLHDYKFYNCYIRKYYRNVRTGFLILKSLFAFESLSCKRVFHDFLSCFGTMSDCIWLRCLECVFESYL